MVEVGVIETPSYAAFIERQHSLSIYTAFGKTMTTLISLTCKNCATSFEYAKKELTRQIKKGRDPSDIFCSLSCARSFKNAHPTSAERKKRSANMSVRNVGNAHAKKGDFTYYLNKARWRKHESDIDESYLSEIWAEQVGICAISGISIHLKKGKNNLDTASLDRIDSSIGYLKGNVQFVAYGINLAKSSFSNEDFKSFFARLIAANR